MGHTIFSPVWPRGDICTGVGCRDDCVMIAAAAGCYLSPGSAQWESAQTEQFSSTGPVDVQVLVRNENDPCAAHESSKALLIWLAFNRWHWYNSSSHDHVRLHFVGTCHQAA